MIMTAFCYHISLQVQSKFVIAPAGRLLLFHIVCRDFIKSFSNGACDMADGIRTSSDADGIC